jgi:hypothetical protein
MAGAGETTEMLPWMTSWPTLVLAKAEEEEVARVEWAV